MLNLSPEQFCHRMLLEMAQQAGQTAIVWSRLGTQGETRFLELQDFLDQAEGLAKPVVFCLDEVELAAENRAFDVNFFPAYNEDCDISLRITKAGMRIVTVEIDMEHVGSATINTNPLLRVQNHLTHACNDRYFMLKWGIPKFGKWGEASKFPFNNPNFHPWRIDPEQRETPYPGRDRTDFDQVVRI